jgi:hypothetical protein
VSGYSDAVLSILIGAAYIFVDATTAIELLIVLTAAVILFKEHGGRMIGKIPYGTILPTVALITGTVLLWDSKGAAALAFTVMSLGYCKVVYDLIMAFKNSHKN